MKTIVKFYIKVDGEIFYMDKMNGMVYLTHKEHLIVGMGKTLLEAITDIKYDLGIIIKEFSDFISELIPYKLHDWAYRNAIYNYTKDGKCQCSSCKYSS